MFGDWVEEADVPPAYVDDDMVGVPGSQGLDSGETISGEWGDSDVGVVKVMGVFGVCQPVNRVRDGNGGWPHSPNRMLNVVVFVQFEDRHC